MAIAFHKNGSSEIHACFMQEIRTREHNICRGISNARQSKCTIYYISASSSIDSETPLDDACATLCSVLYLISVSLNFERREFLLLGVFMSSDFGPFQPLLKQQQ